MGEEMPAGLSSAAQALVVAWDSPGSRGRPGENRIFANDAYAHGPADLPFKPLFWGTCRWAQGNWWEREKSTIFGVEFVLGGNVSFMQNDRAYLVETGDIFLLQPGARHRYATGPAGFCERAFAGFGGTLIESYLTRTGLDAYDVIRSPWPEELLHHLRRFAEPLRLPAKDQKKLSEMAYGFLLYLADAVSAPHPTPVRDALAFIRQNLGRDLSIGEIAAAAHVSVSHLSRLFRSSLQTSPIHYHIAERMARARILLRHTSQSVKEIAQAVGYADPLYFSKQFRKHAGMSPKEFRKGRVLDGRPGAGGQNLAAPGSLRT